jgi:hypothetical protein
MITPKFQWFFHELNSGGKMLSSVVVVAGTKLGSQVFNQSSSIKFLVFFSQNTHRTGNLYRL